MLVLNIDGYSIDIIQVARFITAVPKGYQRLFKSNMN